MKKRVVIFSCGIAFLLMNVIGCSYHYKSNNVQNEQELTETESTRWLDYEDYKNRLLEGRVPISDYQNDYKADIEKVCNKDYGNLSFTSTEFDEFPVTEEICLLRQEEIVLSAQEGLDMMEQWLEEIGKRDLVDMEKEVRVISDPDEVAWDETKDYPYFYPALSEHMDITNAKMTLLARKDCFQLLFYEQSDGKITEYLGKDQYAVTELDEDIQDIEVSGTLEELGTKSYPLLSGEMTIQDGADLLIDYFENGTITALAEGVTLGITGVDVFRLKDVYGYCYDLEKIYKGIPVSYVEKTGFQLVGCPYLPDDVGKIACVVDDTGVSAFRGFSESAPMTELYSDTNFLSVEDAAQLLSEKLAPGLRMEVEEVALEYSPYHAEILYAETLLIPSWRFEGINNTKGEKLVAYVDVLTGDLYYYTIPERHQVE